MHRRIMRDPESGINTNLTLDVSDTGAMSLHLDGEVIPGQTAVRVEKTSSCSCGPDRVVYEVTVAFEVLGNKHRGREAPQAADTPEDAHNVVQEVLDV